MDNAIPTVPRGRLLTKHSSQRLRTLQNTEAFQCPSNLHQDLMRGHKTSLHSFIKIKIIKNTSSDTRELNERR